MTLPLRRELDHVVDEREIDRALADAGGASPEAVRDVLAKARGLAGLDLADAAVLCRARDGELLEEIFEAARQVKDSIYGSRLVLFAPLYLSNHCCNECTYCSFRRDNTEIERHTSTPDEIAAETRWLVDQGHKRLLLVSGEALPLARTIEAIEHVYAASSGAGREIRRVNVNVAPMTVDEFRTLHEARIGTYQIFQETYHRETYDRVHLAGPKRDFAWRLAAMDRAMTAGIDDVGIGTLFGLHDWRFEILALLQHARHLERRFGVGPHTISVPRVEPANGAPFSASPGAEVGDDDFALIVAVLRLAVPYTGIILSTRESPEMRRRCFALGVSQISAGSRTSPGGYLEDHDENDGSQFQLGDHRSLDEVVRDVAALGYVPSFCTACYRLGRTGADFMDLAKPGEIRAHCEPNALSTFQEYLSDFASDETRRVGEALIGRRIGELSAKEAARAERLVRAVRRGRRDVFV